MRSNHGRRGCGLQLYTRQGHPVQSVPCILQVGRAARNLTGLPLWAHLLIPQAPREACRRTMAQARVGVVPHGTPKSMTFRHRTRRTGSFSPKKDLSRPEGNSRLPQKGRRADSWLRRRDKGSLAPWDGFPSTQGRNPGSSLCSSGEGGRWRCEVGKRGIATEEAFVEGGEHRKVQKSPRGLRAGEK